MKPNEIIKKYRKKLGFTQQKIADELFTAVNTYNQYETGKRNIDTDIFFSILKILQIEIFFEELNNENKNTLAVDIYLNLKEKLENKKIHNYSIIHMAYKIEETIISKEIDVNWIDYLEVDITDEKDIYITVDNFTIDFDSKGRVTGSGVSTSRNIPPWSIGGINFDIEDSVKKIVKDTLPSLYSNVTDELIIKFTNSITKELLEIKEANGGFKYSKDILENKINFITSYCISKILSHTQNKDFITKNFEEYFERQSFSEDKIKILPSSIKCSYKYNQLYIEFEIKNIGFFILNLYYLINDNNYTWNLDEVWHDFKKNKMDFVCPYCKQTYDGITPASECHRLNNSIDDLFLLLKKSSYNSLKEELDFNTIIKK